MLFESLLTKLAGASLAAKAAAGGAAVVVATTGAGAAEVLPGPLQDGFDEVVSADAPEEEPDPETDVDVVEEAEDDFGARVSEDARGDAEGDEPGVDGAEIACEASAGRSGTCPDETVVEEGAEEAEGDEVPAMRGFGQEVAEDARGDAEGDEPGVDGQEVSREARDRNPGDGGGGEERDGADAAGQRSSGATGGTED